MERELVPARSTEGKQGISESFQTKATETKRARAGRPKGAKNKAKALIPNELANQILLAMEGKIAADDYEYLKQVVREGKMVSAEREAKIMLAMLRANLLPMMMEEMKGQQITDPEGNVLSVEHKFRSDVTDRLKVWNSLLNTVATIERRNDQGTDTAEKPVFEVFARRGMDGGRLKVLVGYEHGGMDGDSDRNGRGEDQIGAIPDQLPERQIDVSNSQQVEATWHVVDDISGDSA